MRARGVLGCVVLFASTLLASNPTPRIVVVEDCPTFTFTPDGQQILYAVQRILSMRNFEIERDDIWEVGLDGHRRRLVDGQKLVRTRVPFSYAIRSIRISPSGRLLTVAMETRSLSGPGGRLQEGELVDLMDRSGREIPIEGTHNSIVENTLEAVWLADDETVVYTQRPDPGALLFRLAYVRPRAGRGGVILPAETMSAVAWDPARNRAVAVVPPRVSGEPSRLVLIDLLRQSERELARLNRFSGQLSVSPDGQQIGYFRDGEVFELRRTDQPDVVRTLRIPYGRYRWFPDGKSLLLMRGSGNRSGPLFRVDLSSGVLTPLLAETLFSGFDVSPDGQWVAVTEPGRRVLKLFAASDVLERGQPASWMWRQGESLKAPWPSGP